MTQISSALTVTGPQYEPDQCVSDLVQELRARLFGHPEHLRGLLERKGRIRSDRYVRAVLAGEKTMSLSFFVAGLRCVEAVGNRATGNGRDWVRQILDVLARPFGLRVIPAEESTVKDILTEEREANRATHRAFDAVADATADGVVTPAEKSAMSTAIQAARKELDDLEKAVTR